MRRVHLRGRTNILKRLSVHAGAANLGLLMRKVFGAGTPKALQGRLRTAFSHLIGLPGTLRLSPSSRNVECRRFLLEFIIHPAASCVSVAA